MGFTMKARFIKFSDEMDSISLCSFAKLNDRQNLLHLAEKLNVHRNKWYEYPADVSVHINLIYQTMEMAKTMSDACILYGY